MSVRAGRAQPRQTAVRDPQKYQVTSFPSATLGWVANSNLATPTPGGAAMLENMFPTATRVVLRRGCQGYADLNSPDTIRSLFSYVAGTQANLFAATASAIYDITTVGSDLHPVPSSPAVASLSGGEWSVIQFGTPGGIYLRAVNGADTPLVYDGLSWTTTPPITFPPGETLSPSALLFVWAFKRRLFFIQSNSLDVWYLPVDSIGGELTKLPLGGVFSRGGSLLFGATWSLDTGSGLSEQCVFVTTEGEVAVYQGDNPSDASAWSKVGVYRIGRPLGPKAVIHAGGDLVVATDIGFIPLSQALQKDYAVLAPSAVSAQIETAWNDAVAKRSGAAWSCTVWSNNQMVVVAPPTINAQPPEMYVANARTGAWAKFTGWNGASLEVFKGRLFFGSDNGLVIEANITGADQGEPYVGRCIPLFSDFGLPTKKTVSMARAVMRAKVPLATQLTLLREYDTTLPAAPDGAAYSPDNVWGAGTWGGSLLWGVEHDQTTQEYWQSMPGNGYALSPALQITSSTIAPLDAEIVRLDVAFTSNDVVV